MGRGPHKRPAMTHTITVPETDRRPQNSRAGRGYLFVLGLVLALIGSVFVGLMARSFLRAREMRTWPELACTILSSEIGERVHDPQSAPEYRHEVSFGYEWLGQARTDKRLTLRGSPWSSKRELADAKIKEYPVGKKMTCRVNPRDPDFAVLKPDSLAPGYSIWFPSLFVIGGLGISVRSLFGHRPRQKHPR